MHQVKGSCSGVSHQQSSKVFASTEHPGICVADEGEAKAAPAVVEAATVVRNIVVAVPFNEEGATVVVVDADDEVPKFDAFNRTLVFFIRVGR